MYHYPQISQINADLLGIENREMRKTRENENVCMRCGGRPRWASPMVDHSGGSVTFL